MERNVFGLTLALMVTFFVTPAHAEQECFAKYQYRWEDTRTSEHREETRTSDPLAVPSKVGEQAHRKLVIRDESGKDRAFVLYVWNTGRTLAEVSFEQRGTPEVVSLALRSDGREAEAFRNFDISPDEYRFVWEVETISVVCRSK